MENASKALIIAGAILISILIISFGVIILGQGSDVINKANMSDAEIMAYNGKFEAYEGTSVRGSNVKQMIKIVKQHNLQNQDDASKQVEVLPGKKAEDGTWSKDGDTKYVDKSGSDTGASAILSGNAYEVKCQYASGGLVDKIYVLKK